LSSKSTIEKEEHNELLRSAIYKKEF